MKLSALFTSGIVCRAALYTASDGACYLHQGSVLGCGTLPITVNGTTHKTKAAGPTEDDPYYSKHIRLEV